MLSVLLHVLYIPVCIFLILVVLLQTGKRADLAGAFGGGGSQTAFGARGAATLLAKVTTASAVLFMIIALTLSIMTSKEIGGGRTVLDVVGEAAEAPAPAPADPLEALVDPAAAEDVGASPPESPSPEQDPSRP